MQIAINDDITKKGMTILRDFIKDITVTRRNKAAMQQFVDLATKGYLIYGVDVISSTNIIDVWIKYRNLLIAWLDTFTKEYEIRVPFGVLPIDYQARISLLTLLLLARDLIEAHDYAFDGENREIVNTPIVSSTNVTLYDMVRFIYPVALWNGESNEVLSIVPVLSSNTKELFNRSGKWNTILYAPLLVSGIMTENFIRKLAKYLNPEYAGKPGFVTTGLGQAYMKYATLVPRHSLNTNYYYTAITTFTAISHTQYEVLNHVINNVLNTDIYGNIEYMVYEYSKYADYINPLNGHPDFYAQAYTRGDALRDLAAMTFTLINARLELLNKDQKLHDQLVSKYLFMIKPPSELVRDAVRTILLVSGRVT